MLLLSPYMILLEWLCLSYSVYETFLVDINHVLVKKARGQIVLYTVYYTLHAKKSKRYSLLWMKNALYSGLLKIRTPKNPDFCVFAKQGLSKKSGLLCSRQTGLVLKIRTYDFADMGLFKISGAEAHFFVFLDFD